MSNKIGKKKRRELAQKNAGVDMPLPEDIESAIELARLFDAFIDLGSKMEFATQESWLRDTAFLKKATTQLRNVERLPYQEVSDLVESTMDAFDRWAEYFEDDFLAEFDDPYATFHFEPAGLPIDY